MSPGETNMGEVLLLYAVYFDRLMGALVVLGGISLIAAIVCWRDKVGKHAKLLRNVFLGSAAACLLLFLGLPQPMLVQEQAPKMEPASALEPTQHHHCQSDGWNFCHDI